MRGDMRLRWFVGCLLGVGNAVAQGNPRVPTLFVVSDVPAETLHSSFDLSKIHLQDSVVGAQTTRAYLHSGAWNRVLEKVRPGDFVVIDFNNRLLPTHDRNDAVRTLAGFGDGTFDYLDPGTKKVELVHSYGWYLRKMVVDVINQGGVPLVCAGPAHPEQPGAGDWARYIAVEQRVSLVKVEEDGSGLVVGLKGMQADPLAPYLQP